MLSNDEELKSCGRKIFPDMEINFILLEKQTYFCFVELFRYM